MSVFAVICSSAMAWADSPPRVPVVCGTERCVAVVPEGATEIELDFGKAIPADRNGDRKKDRQRAPKRDPRKSVTLVSKNGASKIVTCGDGVCSRVKVDKAWDLKGPAGDRRVELVPESAWLEMKLRAAAGSVGPGGILVPQPRVRLAPSPPLPALAPPPLHESRTGERAASRPELAQTKAVGGATPVEAVVPGGEAVPLDPEPCAAPGPPRRARSAAPDDDGFADIVLVDAHCTGILIAPRAILTAAHCLPATRIVFGSRLDAPLLTLAVREAHRHPGGVDVALLVLAEAPPWAPRPMRDPRAAAPPVGSLELVGFGLDEPRRGAGFGVKRRLPVLAQGWGCDGARAQKTGCHPDFELVLPPISGRDTCDGDSGGPVLEWTGVTWRLIAITSRPTVVGHAACGRGGIYVRVDAVAGWIASILGGAK